MTGEVSQLCHDPRRDPAPGYLISRRRRDDPPATAGGTDKTILSPLQGEDVGGRSIPGGVPTNRDLPRATRAATHFEVLIHGLTAAAIECRAFGAESLSLRGRCWLISAQGW